MTDFAPMLAAKPPENYDWSSFPWGERWLASPKIDGVRVICHPELGAVTRSLKPVPNKFIREILSNRMFAYCDGEVVLDWKDPKTFSKTVSAVMSHDGEPRFEYRVFDWIGNTYPFQNRFQSVKMMEFSRAGYGVHGLEHNVLFSYEEFLATEQNAIDSGFEGLMIRDRHGLYKHGRSTWKEKGLIKVKRYEDAEGQIVDWKPLMRNHNEAKRNELGLTERSSDAAGLVSDPYRIGALVVEIMNGEFAGKFVDVGSGYTDAERLGLRRDIEQMILAGQLLTFKYMPHGGKDAPRHPIYKGLRGNE